MEVGWLEDFLIVADSANFSRAAELRNMTQPALSRRIRALEDWMGVTLFDRTHQPVGLTEAGRAFLPAADEMVRRLYQERDACRKLADNSVGRLHFAATHSLSLTFFPKWLRSIDFGGAPPAIQLLSDSLEDCENIMLQRQAQFLLCHCHKDVPGRLSPGQFPSRRVGDDVLVPVAAAKNGKALYELPGTPGRPIPCLSYNPASGLGRIVASAATIDGEKCWLETVFTSHLASVLRAEALEGRGMAWLPRALISEDLESGLLCRVADDSKDISLEIRLFRSKFRQNATAERLWAAIPSE